MQGDLCQHIPDPHQQAGGPLPDEAEEEPRPVRGLPWTLARADAVVAQQQAAVAAVNNASNR